MTIVDETCTCLLKAVQNCFRLLTLSSVEDMWALILVSASERKPNYIPISDTAFALDSAFILFSTSVLQFEWLDLALGLHLCKKDHIFLTPGINKLLM